MAYSEDALGYVKRHILWTLLIPFYVPVIICVEFQIQCCIYLSKFGFGGQMIGYQYLRLLLQPRPFLSWSCKENEALIGS